MADVGGLEHGFQRSLFEASRTYVNAAGTQVGRQAYERLPAGGKRLAESPRRYWTSSSANLIAIRTASGLDFRATERLILALAYVEC